jgi:hypothetical protein
MRITFSPVGGYIDRRLELVKDGDRLRVNGVWHDFSSLPEGHRWDREQLSVDLLEGPVRRKAGVLEMCFILPYGATDDPAIRFPAPVEVTQDGMIEAPGLFSRDHGPDLGVGVVPETSVNEQTEHLESVMEAARQIINEQVESYARSRGYNDAASFASYTSSTVPDWAAEAKAFVEWRDAVWVAAYTQMAAVQQGAPLPTAEELVASLPPAPVE